MIFWSLTGNVLFEFVGRCLQKVEAVDDGRVVCVRGKFIRFETLEGDTCIVKIAKRVFNLVCVIVFDL